MFERNSTGCLNDGYIVRVLNTATRWRQFFKLSFVTPDEILQSCNWFRIYCLWLVFPMIGMDEYFEYKTLLWKSFFLDILRSLQILFFCISMSGLKRLIKQVWLKSLKNRLLITLTFLKINSSDFLVWRSIPGHIRCKLNWMQRGTILPVNSINNHMMRTNRLFSKLKH